MKKLLPIVRALNGQLPQDWPEDGEPSTPLMDAWLTQRQEQLEKSPGFAFYRRTLLAYVDSWLKSDKHFGRWMDGNPRLAHEFERVLYRTRHFHIYFGREQDQPYVGPAFPPSKTRAGQIHRAVWDFVKLAQSPLREYVGQCERERCRQYYLSKRSKRNKRFCGRVCVTRFWAEVTTKNRRERERQQKVHNASRWLSRFALLKNPRSDWKAWVSKRSRLTMKWLTRAVNKGWLLPPSNIKAGGTHHGSL